MRHDQPYSALRAIQRLNVTHELHPQSQLVEPIVPQAPRKKRVRRPRVVNPRQVEIEIVAPPKPSQFTDPLSLLLDRLGVRGKNVRGDQLDDYQEKIAFNP